MRWGVWIFCLLWMPCAWAGPVIIDGTDSNDHGSCSGGVNVDGWKYLEKALTNLAAQLDPSVTKVLVNLGATAGTEAYDAIHSAFNACGAGFAGIVTQGWTIVDVDGAAAINAWFAALSTSNTGILAITSHHNDNGDLTDDEMDAVNAHAADISAFVGGAGDATQGGAVFSLGEVDLFGEPTPRAYGWLTTLISGISFLNFGGGGTSTDLELTSDGNSAFPGLTNADLSTGPWHNAFYNNLGGLSVLVNEISTEDSCFPHSPCHVIIGGGAGTTFEPTVPAGFVWVY